MRRPDVRAPRQRSGEIIYARTLNAYAEGIDRLRGAPSVHGQTQPWAAPWNPVSLFTISSVDDDYLVCNTRNGTVTVNVAKPYLLRRSITSRNGITYTYTSASERTADDGSSTETQVIVPEYVAGDEIHAILVVHGTSIEIDTVSVKWLDLNADGRAWAKKAS